MTRPLLSLVMIIKNEATSIRGVLEAALPHVDRVTIVDTGSTDGTQDIVREAIANKGELFERPFVDYATTRNLVRDLDRGCPSPSFFQLMLSGDEYLRDGDKLRAALEQLRPVIESARAEKVAVAELYKLNLLIDDNLFPPPRVFVTDSAWHYTDAGFGYHEFPTHSDPQAPVGMINGPWIEHIVSDPDRRFNAVWEEQIPALRAKLEEQPDNPMALMYLAKALGALVPQLEFFHPGERVTYAAEAMSLYMRRLQMPFGTDDERNYLEMCYLDMARWTQFYEHEELLLRCAKLHERDPLRPDTAQLLLNVAMLKMGNSQVYLLAMKTAKVASDAQENGFQTAAPMSTTVAWKALLIAASAARAVAKFHPGANIKGVKFADLGRQAVELGLASGGPPERFRDALAAIEEVDAKNTADQEAADQIARETFAKMAERSPETGAAAPPTTEEK